MNIRHFLLLVIILFISGCTTSGQLYYVDAKGNEKLGCEVEFVGMPSVDKFAVEYALSLCAKSIVKKGGVIQEEHLLMVDTAIPLAPCEKAWTHELAKQQYQSKKLTKKEYGYIVANIDLGLATVNKCTYKLFKGDKLQLAGSAPLLILTRLTTPHIAALGISRTSTHR